MGKRNPEHSGDKDMVGVGTVQHSEADGVAAHIDQALLRAGEAEILERISTGAPLHEILVAIACTMDLAAPAHRSSILLANETTSTLNTGAAPAMPAAFCNAIDGIPIAEGVGACGTSAHRRTPVFVEDVHASPFFAPFLGLAKEHGIRACWSVPVLDSHGAVVATLALYGGTPALPTPTDVQLMQRAAHLVSIAVERVRDEKALRDNETLLRMAMHIGRMGAWRIAVPSNTLTWSDEVYAIFEVGDDFELTLDNALTFYAEAQQLEVAQALERCTVDGVPFDLELPLTSAKGRRICIRAMGEVVRDAKGEVVCMQGALQDITERKLSEQRANLIEERLVKTLDTISEAFITLDRDWRFSYINLEAERILQRSRHELLGKIVWDEYPQAGGPIFEQSYRTAVETGKPIEFEEYYAGLDCWFRVRTFPSSEGLAVYFNDVTENRKAHDVLAASEERFRLLSKAANDAIWDWDLRTDILWWNEGFEILFGYSRSEIEPDSTSWSTRIHPDEAGQILSSIHTVIHGSTQQWYAEYRFRRKDGSYAFVQDRGWVIRDARGLAVRMIGGITDISERKQSELRLAEQAALLDQASDAILVRRLDNVIQYWNKRAEAIYGWTQEEAIGKSVADLLYADASVLRSGTEAVLRDGAWSGELEHLTKAGTTITVFCRWALLRDERGEPKSILAINADITERKRLEQQFLRTQRMESIGTLASGIAHDLNNILSPILMSAELLKDEATSPDAQQTLETLISSARRGAGLIKQVLGFARGIDGKLLVVDPASVIHEAQKILQDTFPRNIEFRVNVPSNLWRIHADPTQLHQVLTNLCVNARDAMPTGGVLSVVMENVLLDEVFAGMDLQAKPGPYVLIRVSDTGTGMTRDVQERIFEPFFTTKELGRGTGLGLSTTFTIVKNHGGFINVYSEPGKGTRFKIYLPAAPGTAQLDENAPLISDGELPQGHGEVVLLVDDEESVRDITRRALERFGYRVITAANGAEGVSAYLQHRTSIAVVLTDMSMPVMDGPAMAIALRSIDPGVQIIGSSGLSANGDVAKALGAGVEFFVPKPYTAEVLLKTLRQVLDKGGQQQEDPKLQAAETTPAETPPAPAKPKPRSTPREPLGITVLLVDDEPVLRELALRMLRTLGCEVTSAADGSEALRLIAEHKGDFDLIVTDLNMPNLGGEDLYRAAIKQYPELRFIFASGSCAVPDTLIADLGPKLCALPKPYSAPDLEAALRNALGR